MDLTEIELLDDNVTIPRQPSKEILQLREEMINHKEGNIKNLAIKFHYDDMVRFLLASLISVAQYSVTVGKEKVKFLPTHHGRNDEHF